MEPSMTQASHTGMILCEILLMKSGTGNGLLKSNYKYMKTYRKLAYLTLALSSTLLLSCSEDSSDPTVIGTGDAKIGMGVKLSSLSNPAARASNAGVEIQTGFLQVKKLKLETTGRNDSGEFEKELELKFPEVKKVDFDKISSEADFYISIPSGQYEEIEVEIDLIDNKSEPSIQLDGTYTYQNGTTVPLRLQVFGDDDDDLDFEVEMESENDDRLFTFDAGNNPLALLEIDGLGWFKNVLTEELETAELTDGVLLITKSKNSQIYNKLVKKIEDSSEIELKLK